MSDQPIRIVVVDDHTLFRRGMTALLGGVPGFAIVGEAADGLEGIRVVAALQPDVVLLDLNMPGISGIEALHAILRASPGLPVVMLTVSEDGRRPDGRAEGRRAGLPAQEHRQRLPRRLGAPRRGGRVGDVAGDAGEAAARAARGEGRRRSPRCRRASARSWPSSPAARATRRSRARSTSPRAPSRSTSSTSCGSSSSRAACRRRCGRSSTGSPPGPDGVAIATGASYRLPLGLILGAQLAGVVAAAALFAWLEPGPLRQPLPLALVQGVVAAAVAAWRGAPRWWWLIHALFVPLIVLALRLPLPPAAWLAAFVALALVFWRTDSSRVPLYLSNAPTAQALAAAAAGRRVPGRRPGLRPRRPPVPARGGTARGPPRRRRACTAAVARRPGARAAASGRDHPLRRPLARRPRGGRRRLRVPLAGADAEALGQGDCRAAARRAARLQQLRRAWRRRLASRRRRRPPAYAAPLLPDRAPRRLTCRRPPPTPFELPPPRPPGARR